MPTRTDRVLTVVLVLAAVAVAASRIHGSFFAKASAAPPSAPIEYVDSWKDALAVGNLAGGTQGAPVKIVAFVDYECPSCAAFHATLEEVASERPRQVEIVHVHYPLATHRFAMPAGRAAECAVDVSGFRALVDLMYTKQDSLGLKSWGSYARDAGIADTLAIHNCAINPDPVTKIVDGRALGNRMNVRGTPTVLINGWRFAHVPTKMEVDAVVDALVAGKTPSDL